MIKFPPSKDEMDTRMSREESSSQRRGIQEGTQCRNKSLCEMLKYKAVFILQTYSISYSVWPEKRNKGVGGGR